MQFQEFELLKGDKLSTSLTSQTVIPFFGEHTGLLFRHSQGWGGAAGAACHLLILPATTRRACNQRNTTNSVDRVYAKRGSALAVVTHAHSRTGEIAFTALFM